GPGGTTGVRARDRPGAARSPAVLPVQAWEEGDGGGQGGALGAVEFGGDGTCQPVLAGVTLGGQAVAARIGEGDEGPAAGVGIRAARDQAHLVELADGDGDRLVADPREGGQVGGGHRPAPVESREDAALAHGQRAVRVELAPQRAERLAEVGGQGGGLVRVGRLARSGGGRVGHPAKCTTGLRNRVAGYPRRAGFALIARKTNNFCSRKLSEVPIPCDRNHAQNTAPDQLPKAPRNAQFDPTITPNTTR